MAKSIKAASVVVTLEAESAKFTAAMERVKQQTHNSTNAMIKSLAGVQAATAQWANTTTQLFAQPFLAFKKAIAPFQIACSQIIQIASNLIHPFKNLVQYVSGPFINGLQRGLAVARNALTTFSIAGAAALGALSFFGVGVVKNQMDLSKWAAGLNVSVKELNEFSYGLRVAGMEVDGIGDSIKTLNERIADTAMNGGVMLDFFKVVTQQGEKAAMKLAKSWASEGPLKQMEMYMDALDKLRADGKSGDANFFANDIGDQFFEAYAYAQLTGKTFKELKADAKEAGSSLINTDNMMKLKLTMGAIHFEMESIMGSVINGLSGPLNDMFVKYDKLFKNFLTKDGTQSIETGYKDLVKRIGHGIIDAVSIASQGIYNFFDTLGQVIDGVKQMVEKYTDVRFTKSVNPLAAGKVSDDERAELTRLKKDRETTQSIEESSGKMSVMRSRYDVDPGFFKGEKDEVLAAIVDRENTLIDKINSRAPQGQDWNTSIQGQTKKWKEEFDSGLNKPDTVISPQSKTSRGSYDIDSAGKISAAAKKNKEALESAHRQREAVLESLGLGKTSSEYERTLGDKKRQIEEAFEKEIQAETELHGAKSANIAKLKAEREKAIQDMSKLEKVKYDEQVSYFNKYKQLDTQSLLHKLGMYSGVTDAELEYQEQIRQGHDDIERWFREREENTLKFYSKDSDEYRKLIEEKKKMDDEFAAHARANTERVSAYANAASGGVISNIWGAINDFDTYMDSRESVIKGVKNGDLDGGLDENIQKKLKDGDKLNDMEKEQVEKANLQKGIILAKGADQIATMMAGKNKKAFEAQKALNIALATMDMYKGASKALGESSPWMAAGMMAMVIALGTMNIANIASQKYTGMAHDGIDNIPREGTWLLDGGERVVDKRTNGDLKQYLAEKNTQGSKGGNMTYAPVNHFNTSVNEDDILRLLAKQPDKFKQVLLRGY